MLFFIKIVGALWKFVLNNKAVLLDSLQLPGSFLDGANSLEHHSAGQITGDLIEWNGNLCSAKPMRGCCNTRSQKFLYDGGGSESGMVSGRHA